MQNELVLISSLILYYGLVFCAYKYMGKTGLYIWTAIATIVANIEVAIMIEAFGMEQTLGNVLFASTFLVTDILSENHGKKAANKAVVVGIFANAVFILMSRMWFVFTPSSNDFIMPYIEQVFANTPRFIVVGITVYAVCQVLDVWLYHFIWSKTTEIFKNSKKYLFIRNNCSTLFSQLVNSVLFTFGAFYGLYDIATLISIAMSTYIVYVVTSLLDTPIVYLSRKYKNDN